jgi:predicted RNase H-like HicB family nuclease
MLCTIVNGKEKRVEQREIETERAELRVTSEEARRIASLLRYAISLNTTAGLVSPTARRLATPTYRSVELAALVLEGKTFEEATQEAEAAWSGFLEEYYSRALELMQTHRDALQDAMAGLMGPEQFSKYLEISQKQFLELVKAQMPQPTKTAEG